MPVNPMLIQQDPALKRKHELAQSLAGQSLSSAPVQSPFEALARVGQAYFAKKGIDSAESDMASRNDAARKTLAEAISPKKVQTPFVDEAGESFGIGTPPGLVASEQDVHKSYQEMAAILSGNKDTAPFALQLQLSDAEQKAKLAAELSKPTESPSSVREYEFFKKLPQDERAQFMGLKRQGYEIEKIGNVPHLVSRIPGIPPIPLSSLTNEVSGAAAVAGGTKSAQTIAEGQSKAILDIPKAEATANRTVTLIDELKSHPGRKLATGGTSVIPKIPGTPQADFIARLDQIKGQQFLEAFQMLKGGGQITEVEGTKAENAMARMDRAQSEGEFLKSLEDFQDAVRVGISKLKQKAGVPQNPQGNPQGTPQTRKVIGGKTYVKREDGWYEE